MFNHPELTCVAIAPPVSGDQTYPRAAHSLLGTVELDRVRQPDECT
jgi:hypothetical protein